MAELENKIKMISNMYRNLKKTNEPSNQYQLLFQLQKLCKQTYEMLDISSPTVQNTRRMKQVKDIQNKIDELKHKNAQKYEEIVKNEMKGQKQKTNQLSRQELSKRVTRTIAFEEIKSSQMKVSPEKVNELVKQMQGNLNLMKQIQGIIVQQGQDIDLIESNIQCAYQKMKDCNKQLDQACQIQNQTRLMKIRAGVTGIFATLGWGIMGIPGAFLGLFAGWRATK